MLKHLILRYVPGAGILCNFTHGFQYLNLLDKRLEKFEEAMLPHFTARLLAKLAPWESEGISLIRIGNDGDGGYVMGDIFDKVDAAYSFGIAEDVTWDKQIANRSIPVFMYDHTIDKLPEVHPKFHFFKTGICGKPNLPQMKDIGTLIKENGHQGKNLLLKMDIEGFEYPLLMP